MSEFVVPVSGTDRPQALILGAGQLAQMLVEAASGLGVDVTVWATADDEPASRIAARVLRGDPADEAVARRALAAHSLLLFESEFFPTETLERIAPEYPGCRWVPDVTALRLLRDKAEQKRLADRLKIPTARWIEPEGDTAEEFLDRCSRTFPEGYVLKAARGGYDGRGICFSGDSRARQQLFVERTGAVYAEAKVPFRKEAALVGVRGEDGSFLAYPLFAIDNGGGICRWVFGPTEAAGLTKEQHRAAEQSLRWIAESVHYVGTIAAEFFVTDSGALSLNEVAPRVHNSGHVTRTAAMVSQFANHWRAALRWPLGSTEMAPAFVMRNVIGPEGIQLPAARCPVPEPSTGAATYWYGKSARPGRKLGHLDAVAYSATSIAELAQRLEAVEAAWLRAVTEAAVQ
jgi:5-(carboxyamino)imidazole ribonucleotide synthase